MSQQIKFLEMNKVDFTYPGITATASQGADFAKFALNRNNISAWATTGSVDADNTTFEVDSADVRTVSTIILVKHNFKSYHIEYWDGSAWLDFVPAIQPTNDTKETSEYIFTQVVASKFRITILGTQVADSEKFLYQFIATRPLGQFNGWPLIKKPEVSRNRSSMKMLSGKVFVREQVGNFSFDLNIKVYSDDEDLTLIENLYAQNQGFLVWLCGGDEDQFSTIRVGYRKEDFFLCKLDNEYRPEYYKGLYRSGILVNMSFSEVVA